MLLIDWSSDVDPDTLAVEVVAENEGGEVGGIEEVDCKLLIVSI